MNPVRHKQAALYAALIIFLVFTFAPFALMLMLSLKTNADIYADFWGIPREVMWSHYALAGAAIWRYVINSMIICAVAVTATLALSSLAGYVFARHEFPFKEGLFHLILALMMIPGVLTLIPAFLLVKHLGLLNTWWGLWLPYISGQQIFGILLCRTFIAQIPGDIFDAARIDGAGEMRVYLRIVIPLSFPILATIAIMTFFTLYNDFVWPLLVITDSAKQVFTVALTLFGGQYRLDMGPILAGYAIGSLPLLLAISLGMRYFIRGITSGALKA